MSIENLMDALKHTIAYKLRIYELVLQKSSIVAIFTYFFCKFLTFVKFPFFTEYEFFIDIFLIFIFCMGITSKNKQSLN